MYSEKATKILQNLPLTFDYSTYRQKLGEDFAKFCGLLRIYELYDLPRALVLLCPIMVDPTLPKNWTSSMDVFLYSLHEIY